MNLSYHKSISIAEDVLQRIEQMDEFQNQHDKVVIMGDYNCATENLQIMMPSIMGISNDSFLNDSYHYTIIWNYCFGDREGAAGEGNQNRFHHRLYRRDDGDRGNR